MGYVDVFIYVRLIMRCVNIDWLEVYVLEDRNYFPCNADFFRSHGYFVRERDYGTRQYNEMFTLEDEHGEPFLEVRRNPCSGDSSFSGLVAESSHIRLVNRSCYFDDAVDRLRGFLIKFNYVFKRIFRVDVCLDFEKFDSGDDPARFCRRYLAGRYTKINQCKISSFGKDNWSAFDWETLSWGARTSMVSTKLYNKTKELAQGKGDKPWIKWSWYLAGLVDNPITLEKRDKNGAIYKPDIWRLEFSLKSAADNWIIIEDQSGKRVKKKAVQHRLSMFDSRDKLWQRMQDLCFHYFRFKKYKEGVRKDRCEDKGLFRFDTDHIFHKVSSLPADVKPDKDNDVLLRRLRAYRDCHSDMELRQACGIIIDQLERAEFRRVSPRDTWLENETLRRTLAEKLSGSPEDTMVIMARIRELLIKDEIW